MFDTLMTYYAEYFTTSLDDKKHLILRSTVCLDVLNMYLNKWIRDEGTKPIEQLDEETKNKFWDIAKQYQTEKEKRIQAANAAYALYLIIH